VSAPRTFRALLGAAVLLVTAALLGSLGSGPAAAAKSPPPPAAAKPSSPPQAAPFTADQAYQGRFTFIAQCAECHGGDLHGQFGPALQGPDSNVPWQTPKAVWAYMTVHMPVGNAGGLPQRDYLNIMAFIMQSNGRRAGRAELSPAAIGADPAALDQTR
jgi:mono/diheme cytochrome c family protein